MKKKIKIIGVKIFIIMLFLSCNDDFLEKYPLDRVSSETFWKSENDLKAYNNSLYNMTMNDNHIPILMGHGNWYLDGFSDNIMFQSPTSSFYSQVRAGKHTIPSNPVIYGYRGWDFVRACNFGLENYHKADLSQSVIERYIAEARLFRGWFYADKVSKFGDVLWIGKELNIDSDELYAKRTPREEIMENVLADLNFACEKLPANWGDGNEPGRLNKWAALQIKSRVCLFEGTWRKYHGGTNSNMWLEEAANAAEELIKNGHYSLYNTGNPNHDYNASHRATDLTGNSEIIYWRKFKEGILLNNVMGSFTSTNGGATKSIIEDYLCTDGLPISISPLYQGDDIYENIFENRDPRLRQTILHPDDQEYYEYRLRLFHLPFPRVVGMESGATQEKGGTTNETGYHIIKFYEIEADLRPYNMGETPAIILRLGEALLNFAEAKAELGEITQADLDLSINKLRDRAGMPHMQLANVPVDPKCINDGISPLIVEIRRERRVELFNEGFRYDDLRRWKQGKKLENRDYGMRWDLATRSRFDPEEKSTVRTSMIDGIEYIDVFKGTDWDNPVFDENKHYLWPIPLSIISQNTNTGQNPGWN